MLPELNPHLSEYQRNVKELWRMLPMFSGPATYTAGGIIYSTATAIATSAAGTAGQALISGGTGAPTWFSPTAGSVIFGGTGGTLQEDNANFFWDDTNNRFGIGTAAPGTKLDIQGSAGVTLNAINLGGTTTAPDYLSVVNTGASLRLGIESSTGGGLVVGGLAYAAAMGTVNSTALHLYTNNTVRLTVDTSGNIGVATTTPGTLVTPALALAGQFHVKAPTTVAARLMLESDAQSDIIFNDSGGSVDSRIGQWLFDSGSMIYRKVTDAGGVGSAILTMVNSSSAATFGGALTVTGIGSFSSTVGIGTAAPDYTLELLGATAPKLALGDTGLAHGVTDLAQTDSYFVVEQVANDAGGARLFGF